MWSKTKEPIGFDKTQALYHWTSFPFIDRPKHSVFVCLVLLFVAYCLWQIFMVREDPMPLYYILGVLMMFIALFPYFVPTSYYFFETGFLVQYPFVQVERLYTDYGCFYADKMGIMLSTYKMPRRMDTFRGQSIRFSKNGEEREAILAFLEGKMKRY
jgi:hypothetical protein